MSRTPSQIEASREEIKSLINAACHTQNITRSQLADILGIRYSTLCGYVTRCSVQSRIHRKLEVLRDNPPEITKSEHLSKCSLELLVKEIESRGWNVELRTNPKKLVDEAAS